jgi:hypothetical protein
MLTVVKLADVNGQPEAKLELPSAQIGDPLGLRFQLERRSSGRFEVLKVTGRFRVTARALDGTQGLPRQLLTVESVGKVPTWRSVKPPARGRRLGPARFPRTPIA